MSLKLLYKLFGKELGNNKEKNEISLIIDDATTRYENFIKIILILKIRIAQHHIANHLGITPTQLSRIRKKSNLNICK